MAVPGNTTVPSGSTEDGGTHRDELVLRWVFPRWDHAPTHIGAEPIVLGRDESCDVVLPGRETSRFHAELRREGPLLVVRDRDSMNGVHVDGVRVTEAPLGPGSVLRLGDWIALGCSSTSGSFTEVDGGLYAGPVLGPLLDQVRRAAPSELALIVAGETGTGKERVARALHAWSGRRGPFVGVNCAALPESLAEGELFGYRKGAFTGAERNNPGHFRAAHGGTLLLDEIGDLPTPIQAKLLRAIEEREVLPLGESVPIAIDVRLVATAQEPLELAVRDGRFRADLFARLDGLTIVLPPLRERREEVPYLFVHLVAQHAGGRTHEIDPRLVEALCLYDLPFNVRELDRLARRLLVLHGEAPMLKREHLPERMRGERPTRRALHASAPAASPPANGEAGFDRLLDALRQHGGVLARAAASLGISRQRAYRMLDAHGGVDLDALRAARDEDP